MQNGDVIRGVDGKPIRSLPHAKRLLEAFQAGRDLRLEVLRGGRRRAIQYRVK
jgi:type II secretory pathway component PulC